MLETMKRLDAHANALLLTGASDIDLLGGMFDVMPDFKALLDAGFEFGHPDLEQALRAELGR